MKTKLKNGKVGIYNKGKKVAEYSFEELTQPIFDSYKEEYPDDEIVTEYEGAGDLTPGRPNTYDIFRYYYDDDEEYQEDCLESGELADLAKEKYEERG